MANGHGGYRRPSKPAPVSGPGQLSRRTDGGPSQRSVDLPNAAYGENQAFTQDEHGASMAAAAPPPRPAPVPLTAPTQRPAEPVTAGNALGPGPGPGPAQTFNQRSTSDLLAQLAASDPTGQVADIAALARRSGF